MKEELKQELIKEAINRLENPWKNLTVKDVSKDLKMGENLTNELFKRADFPSINIGKTKTITAIAYALWKLEKGCLNIRKTKEAINIINNCKEIRVPIEIMNVRNLTITQKVLLSQIAGLDNKEGCFATNSYFAELFNLSKTQISSLISDLKEKGWINIKYVYKENTK